MLAELLCYVGSLSLCWLSQLKIQELNHWVYNRHVQVLSYRIGAYSQH